MKPRVAGTVGLYPVLFLVALLEVLVAVNTAFPVLQERLLRASMAADAAAGLSLTVLSYAATLPLCAVLFGPVRRSESVALDTGIRYAMWILAIPLVMQCAVLFLLALQPAGPTNHLTGRFTIGTFVPAVMGVFIWCHLLLALPRGRRVAWKRVWLMSGSGLLLLSLGTALIEVIQGAGSAAA